MHVTTFLILTISSLRSFVFCDTKFIDPPDWDDDEHNRLNPVTWRRYLDGEIIPLRWETDAEFFSLWLVQVVDSNQKLFQLDNSRTSWEAKYDEWDRLENGEDALYYFDLRLEGVRSFRRLAISLPFNVTAPKKDITRTVTVSQSRPTEHQTSSTAINTTPEETKPPSDEGENTSKPGMSKGELTGAAIGGVVGGLLIFGTIAWVLWRKMARSKADKLDMSAVQHQEQVVETKAELPGDNRVHPSEYAKSPTGIYEAP